MLQLAGLQAQALKEIKLRTSGNHQRVQKTEGMAASAKVGTDPFQHQPHKLQSLSSAASGTSPEGHIQSYCIHSNVMGVLSY